MKERKLLKPVHCKKCGRQIKSYSPMRKWCVDCRKLITIEQLKTRKER